MKKDRRYKPGLGIVTIDGNRIKNNLGTSIVDGRINNSDTGKIKERV